MTKYITSILTILVVLTLTCCSVGKLVKKTTPVEVKNTAVQLNIPLSKPNTEKPIQDVTTTLTRSQKIQATNDVVKHVGVIVLIVCFIPVIILYINWCMSSLFKLYQTLKTYYKTK